MTSAQRMHLAAITGVAGSLNRGGGGSHIFICDLRVKIEVILYLAIQHSMHGQ